MNQATIAASIIGIALVGSAFIASGSLSSGPKVKKFNIVMENNRYIPAEIVAGVGDAVIINFENRDDVAHGVALSQFNATIPNGHVPANGTARMEFVATTSGVSDAAVCGGANPSDTTDDHGEMLKVTIK